MNITYVGPMDHSGAAYPIINKNITNSLFKLGYTVLNNFHTFKDEITELALAHEYPPRPLNLKHPKNICFTAWEFGGSEGFPIQKRKAVNTYDLLCVPSLWIKDQIENSLDIPVAPIYWGYDYNEYQMNRNRKYPLNFEGIKVLWVGGTDHRHGFDIALKVLDLLPENYFLVAKQSKYYPKDATPHPRLHLIYDDLSSLYPLYNACDVYLQSGRGVGFSLPTLEALVSGLPVVSTDLPPIREFKHAEINFSSKGYWTLMEHHLYTDCYPLWWEPDVQDLAQTLLKTNLEKKVNTPLQEYYLWLNATRHIMEQIDAH